MNVQNVTFEQVMIAAALLYLILQIYNTYCTARKNRRDEENRKGSPASAIETKLEAESKRIDALEGTVRKLEQNQNDTHAGTMALCEGVQALLEHELHNGNSDEMESASKSIGKWLRSR